MVASVRIGDAEIAYQDMGSGEPVLFLHGMPSSSFVWRNVIPYVARLNRCIAIDLMAYTIDDQLHYLRQFIELLKLKNVVLVMHGAGSVLGFTYAMQHEHNCRALIFYEAYLRAVTLENISLPYLEQLQLSQNQMHDDAITDIIAQGMLEPLPTELMTAYCKPFQTAPIQTTISNYLKDMPKGDGDNKIDQWIKRYSVWLQKTALPKLLLYATPGFLTSINAIVWAKQTLAHLSVVDVGEALHYAQETAPDLFGESISVWLQSLEQNHCEDN